MSWFRLDDRFHGNPKVLAAGNAAVGLYVRCGTYCADHLTDGFVPKNLAKNYGKPSEIRALLDVGLWTENDTHYVMPDYLDFNPSKQVVEAERAAAKERMARRRSGDVRANTERTSDQVREPRPDPTRKTIPPSPPTSTESPRRAGVVEHFIRIGRDQHIAKGHTIKNESGFSEFMAGKARGNPDLDRWLEMFPAAPTDAIAAWLHGDKGSMRYYERSDEIATVTELRPA